MKRFLPFIIILLVALITAGAATYLYRSKMQAAAKTAAIAAAATPAPTPEQENATDSLHARGPAKAPVTLEIYGDFQCPSCATTTGVVDEIEKEYSGKLRVVFHEFPLAMHTHAVPAAMAAEAAGEQGQFWEMHDMLYRYQGVWSRMSDPERFFHAYAQELGLDPVRFSMDLKSPELMARVKSEGDAGVARGVQNTPTLFVNGVQVHGTFSKDALRSAIESALRAKEKG